MGIPPIRRRHTEPFVVIGQIGLQEGIGRLDVVDTGQPHGFDQPVLQSLEQPLDPPLRLRRQRLDGDDAQAGCGALELRRFGIFRIVLGKDAVPVAVERCRASAPQAA